jgi:hypothetical protein
MPPITGTTILTEPIFAIIKLRTTTPIVSPENSRKTATRRGLLLLCRTTGEIQSIRFHSERLETKDAVHVSRPAPHYSPYRAAAKPREVLETLGQELRTLYGPPQDLSQELSILLKELETACAPVTDGWP